MSTSILMSTAILRRRLTGITLSTPMPTILWGLARCAAADPGLRRCIGVPEQSALLLSAAAIRR
jgi:hypothetical protein